VQYTEPRIFCIASTSCEKESLEEYLKFLGIPGWKTDAFSSAELLIEVAGRRCYRSWETEKVSVSEQNPNLSKTRKGNGNYIKNILKSKHGSVLEHAYVTYAIENVSRVFTHEIVRHRLCNFSQESLRFVRPTELKAYFPDAFREINDIVTRQKVERILDRTFTKLEDVQQDLIDVLGMDQLKKTFSEKKKLQSAMRRLLPMGMQTGIIVTANHRSWRHMIAMRTAAGAEEEIQKVFNLIAKDLRERYPAIYQDMREVYGLSGFIFQNERV